VEETLEGRGHIVVRYSGTEPLARVMIEGQDAALIEQLADDVAAVIAEAVSKGGNGEPGTGNREA